MFPISHDLSSELRFIVLAYGGFFLMLNGFERIPPAPEELLHNSTSTSQKTIILIIIFSYHYTIIKY